MGDHPDLHDLFSPFVSALPVDGGSISVISRSGVTSTVSTSDALATRLDSLQQELGEGPHWVAFTSSAAVLVPDTAQRSAHGAWPVFGAALSALPVRGVFSLPLVLGVLTVGVADLYSTAPRAPWSDRQLVEARTIAAATAGPAVRLATRSAAAERGILSTSTAELRREVHQATGVVMVHLDVGPDVALARLEGHAFSSGRPLLEVARDVLAHRLDLRGDEA